MNKGLNPALAPLGRKWEKVSDLRIKVKDSRRVEFPPYSQILEEATNGKQEPNSLYYKHMTIIN
jgi:hypothetical protein